MSYAKAGDFDRALPVTPRVVSAARRSRGRLAHLSGTLAEDSVARVLEGRGMTILARRWRDAPWNTDAAR